MVNKMDIERLLNVLSEILGEKYGVEICVKTADISNTALNAEEDAGNTKHRK